MTRQNGCVLAKRLATDAGLMPQVAASIANHTFRRTFITTGRQMGIPLDDLSKTVGHANLTTTQIYDRRDDRFRDKSYEIAGHLAQLAS